VWPATTAVPAVGFDQPGQHLQRRRLARAVGTDDAEDFTALDVEGAALDGDEVAVLLPEAVYFEYSHWIARLREPPQ